MASDLKFADVTAECGEVIRAHLGLVLGAIAGITALYTLIDLLPNKNASTFPGALIGIYAQYHFIEALMPEYIVASEGRKRRYWAMFASGFLSSLGIIFGMVFLIVPGLYLMARWSASTPFIVAEGMGGVDALKASWKATDKARWPLFFVISAYCGALVLLCLGVGVAIGVTEVIFHQKGNSLVASISTNVLVSMVLVGSWVLSVAIYRCLKPSMAGLAEVFA